MRRIIDPTGAIVATYDKLHMFDVDLPTGETARESSAYEPGEAAVVVDTPFFNPRRKVALA